MDWKLAEEHIRELREGYVEVGAIGRLGLFFVNNLITRLDRGERTQELYGEIMECN